jgi:hypothetical protein
MLKVHPITVHVTERDLPPPGTEINDIQLHTILRVRRNNRDLEHQETASEGRDGLGAFRGLEMGLCIVAAGGIFLLLKML